MMRRLIALLSLLPLCLCLRAAETMEPVINTNGPSPFLSGPMVELVNSATTWTNIGVAAFGIKAGDRYGAGVVALYNISPFVATGLGIDWLDSHGGQDQVTMPSCQVQFQAPMRIGGPKGVSLRWFAFTGVATPIAGEGSDNGTAVGLFGAGLGVTIYGGFHGFYAIEDRTGQKDPWHLIGIAWSKDL